MLERVQIQAVGAQTSEIVEVTRGQNQSGRGPRGSDYHEPDLSLMNINRVLNGDPKNKF